MEIRAGANSLYASMQAVGAGAVRRFWATFAAVDRGFPTASAPAAHCPHAGLAASRRRGSGVS